MSSRELPLGSLGNLKVEGVSSSEQAEVEQSSKKEKKNMKKKTIVVNLPEVYKEKKNECSSKNKGIESRFSDYNRVISQKHNTRDKVLRSSYVGSQTEILRAEQMEVPIKRNCFGGTHVIKGRKHQSRVFMVLKPFGVRIMQYPLVPAENVSVKYLKKFKANNKSKSACSEEQKGGAKSSPPRKAATDTRLDTSKNELLKEWLREKNLYMKRERAAKRKQKNLKRMERRKIEQQKQERERDSEQHVRIWMERKKKEASVPCRDKHSVSMGRTIQTQVHNDSFPNHCPLVDERQSMQAVPNGKLMVDPREDFLPPREGLIAEGQLDLKVVRDTILEDIPLECNVLSSKTKQHVIVAPQLVSQISRTIPTSSPNFKPLACQLIRKEKPKDKRTVQVMRSQFILSSELPQESSKQNKDLEKARECKVKSVALHLDCSKATKSNLTALKGVTNENNKLLLNSSIDTFQYAKEARREEIVLIKNSMILTKKKVPKSEICTTTSQNPIKRNECRTSLRLSNDEWLQRKKEENKKNEEKLKSLETKLDSDLKNIVPDLARRRREAILEGKKKVNTGIFFDRSSHSETISTIMTQPTWVEGAKLASVVEQRLMHILSQDALKTSTVFQSAKLKSAKELDKCQD